MKKLVICIIVVAIIVLGFFALNKKPEETVNNEEVIENEEVVSTEDEFANDVEEVTKPTDVNADELTKFVDELYAGNENLFPSLMTQAIDMSDTDSVKYMTGLSNTENIEAVVVSEPMMSSQAYSLVLVKVKSGANADSIAKEMSENIDMRKWICVSAEVLYATSTEDLAFLVMSSEDMAKPVYDAFKKKVEDIGEEYTKAEVVEELPEDMY